MEPITDTPETDAHQAQESMAHDWLWRDFACKLERERDEALKAAKKSKAYKRVLKTENSKLRAQLREEQQLHVQTLNERDEARQWESQALVARIQRDEFSKTLGEVREIICAALPNENAPTSFMAVKLVKERDEARVLADRLAEAIRKHQVELPFRADFCDVELYEALATLKEARCES